MKIILFKILSSIGVLNFLRKSKKNDLTVLSLHRISDENDFFFDPINPTLFEELVVYCLKHYSIITFKDIEKQTPKPKLILSFDDGYYDFIEFAVPILMKYNVPCNHNLVNACLHQKSIIWTHKLNDIFGHLKRENITSDKFLSDFNAQFNGNWWAMYASVFQSMLKMKRDEREILLMNWQELHQIKSNVKMMSWEDAVDCHQKYNVEIGCHTYNHESLLSVTSHIDLENEIGKSIEELENKIGCKVNVLALPNGQHNDDVIKYVKHKNIKYTLLVDDKTTDLKNISDSGNLISRINLINESKEEMLLRTELFHAKLKQLK